MEAEELGLKPGILVAGIPSNYVTTVLRTRW